MSWRWKPWAQAKIVNSSLCDCLKNRGVTENGDAQRTTLSARGRDMAERSWRGPRGLGPGVVERHERWIGSAAAP
jgi:hypothetical protein